MTPKVTGEGYFRIVGSKDGKYAFSNVLKCYLKYYLGEIKFLTVNDENLKDYYITKENDKINIKIIDAFVYMRKYISFCCSLLFL